MQTDVNFFQLTIPNKLLTNKMFVSKNVVWNIHYSVVQKILGEKKGCYIDVYDEFSEFKVLTVYSVMVNRGLS